MSANNYTASGSNVSFGQNNPMLETLLWAGLAAA
jgi:hypothetical protein